MGDVTRAVLVAHNGGLFGAERSLLELARGLAARPRFEVLVLVPHAGALADECRLLGIDTLVAGHRQWIGRDRRLSGTVKRGVRNLAALWRSSGPLRRFAPDVVYTGTGTTPFGALVARRLGVPHIWHLREFGERDYGARYDWGRRWSERFIATRADRLVANSEAVRDHFADRLGRSDIEIVYNGFEFPPAPEEQAPEPYRRRVADVPVPELLLIGALVEGKGQHDAIRALAELAARGRPLRLILAGAGDPHYAERLRRLVHLHRLTAAVEFAGFVPDPAALYRRAALTLVCSRCEGFGRTAVESLSAGTPVVGTDAGGLPEILRPGGVGALYPAGDWMALADAIDSLLDDPERYNRIATAGPVLMRRRFDRARYVRELGDLLADAGRGAAASTPARFAHGQGSRR